MLNLCFVLNATIDFKGGFGPHLYCILLENFKLDSDFVESSFHAWYQNLPYVSS